MKVSAELQRSKRIALITLLIASFIWLGLLILMKFIPEHNVILHIFLLSAEAGIIGGLADWYAVTVLFRNPFKGIPIPAFLRNHTEILPRNQARIAYSMGRFVQENFLSPHIVNQTLQSNDLSLKLGIWLSQPNNQQYISNIVQSTLPKSLDFISQQQLAEFIKQNTIQWLQNTPIDKASSELLKAILENDFHQETLQHLLNQTRQWIYRHPDQMEQLISSLLKEAGIWKIAQGASLFGFNIQQKSVNAIINKINDILSEPEHPIYQRLEKEALNIMQQLTQPNSPASLRLNQIKNDLLNSPAVLGFMTQAIMILCDAIKNDLQQPNSGIALHLQLAIQQLGENLQNNPQVRQIINQQINLFAIQISEQYSDKVIQFISQQIQSWDTSEMITKIENEVGRDLHMIRVNGVIVGAILGFMLGIIRAIIEWI